jgi:hypothetical protein
MLHGIRGTGLFVHLYLPDPPQLPGYPYHHHCTLNNVVKTHGKSRKKGVKMWRGSGGSDHFFCANRSCRARDNRVHPIVSDAHFNTGTSGNSGDDRQISGSMVRLHVYPPDPPSPSYNRPPGVHHSRSRSLFKNTPAPGTPGLAAGRDTGGAGENPTAPGEKDRPGYAVAHPGHTTERRVQYASLQTHVLIFKAFTTIVRSVILNNPLWCVSSMSPGDSPTRVSHS